MPETASQTTIRPATPADVSAMFDVRLSVRENTLTAQELAQIGVTPAAIAQAVAGAPCAWVAERRGAVVGFAMVELDTACLFAAFVRPEHEGGGLGSRLVQACESALFARHAVAWLDTDAASRAAAFYRRRGWVHAVDIGGGDVRLYKHRPDGA